MIHGMIRGRSPNSNPVIELEGFDIDDNVTSAYYSYRHYSEMTDDIKERTKRLALLALEAFKDPSGKRYKFVSLQKATLNRRHQYYLTFTAKPEDDPSEDVVKTIQAIVRHCLAFNEVLFCRIS